MLSLASSGSSASTAEHGTIRNAQRIIGPYSRGEPRTTAQPSRIEAAGVRSLPAWVGEGLGSRSSAPIITRCETARAAKMVPMPASPIR